MIDALLSGAAIRKLLPYIELEADGILDAFDDDLDP